MSRKLHIGNALHLPLDLVTQTIAILAKRGVGKSYTAAVIAEELLGAGQQLVVIDPTGAHWGLRSSADGGAGGYPIVVIGGDHADIPLEEGSGEIIARSIVEQRFSAILDLSLLRKGAANRFIGAFLETLYRLNRDPLHVICDEADTFAPQRVMGDEARTCGAMEDAVKKGRIRGLGMTLITQRPAVLNKNVLTQCEMLVAMRMVHPKDIEAINEWVGAHGEPAKAAELVKSLPSLPIGEAWFWSPGWGEVFQRVKVRQRRTFDSGATPKPGQRTAAPRVLAQVDIGKLGEQIAATVERAKADDPKRLKARIAELDRELSSARTGVPEAEVQRRIREAVATVPRAQATACGVTDPATRKALEHLVTAASKLLALETAVPAPIQIRESPAPTMASATHLRQRPATGAALSKAERLVLTALAQYPDGRTKNQVAILTGYAVNGGGFNNAISACRSRSYLQGSWDRLQITGEGLRALGPFDPLPHGAALLQHWYGQLGKAERACLEALVGAHPQPLIKEDLAARAGYEPNGGGFNNALSRLRTLELIFGNKDALRASEDLFE